MENSNEMKKPEGDEPLRNTPPASGSINQSTENKGNLGRGIALVATAVALVAAGAVALYSNSVRRSDKEEMVEEQSDRSLTMPVGNADNDDFYRIQEPVATEGPLPESEPTSTDEVSSLSVPGSEPTSTKESNNSKPSFMNLAGDLAVRSCPSFSPANDCFRMIVGVTVPTLDADPQVWQPKRSPPHTKLTVPSALARCRARDHVPRQEWRCNTVWGCDLSAPSVLTALGWRTSRPLFLGMS